MFLTTWFTSPECSTIRIWFIFWHCFTLFYWFALTPCSLAYFGSLRIIALLWPFDTLESIVLLNLGDSLLHHALLLYFLINLVSSSDTLPSAIFLINDSKMSTLYLNRFTSCFLLLFYTPIISFPNHLVNFLHLKWASLLLLCQAFS